jgi:hypothetical protein
MSAERLLQHFDRISAAPDAVARLLRFILDLAVRDKGRTGGGVAEAGCGGERAAGGEREGQEG